MHRLFDAQRIFRDAALPDQARRPTLIRWLRGPHVDSPHDIQAAREALVSVGYSPSEADRALTRYVRRIRGALANPADTALAGLLSAAAMAMAVLALLILALEVPVRRWELGGYFGSLYAYASAPLVPNIMPEALLVLVALCVVGASTALVLRHRWRRADLLNTFDRPSPSRIAVPAWLGAAGLLLLEAGLTVFVGWWLIVVDLVGESTQLLTLQAVVRRPLIGTLAQALIFLGIPLGALAFATWFPGLHAWILPRVTQVNAAAHARPIVEREAARQAAAARELYSRSAYRWANHVTRTSRPRSGRASHAPELSRPRTAHRSRARRSAARRWRSLGWSSRLLRLSRYGLLTSVITLAVWRLPHILSWIYRPESVGRYGHVIGHPIPGYGAFVTRTKAEVADAGLLASSEFAAWVDPLALLGGLALGAGVTWAYARYVGNP